LFCEKRRKHLQQINEEARKDPKKAKRNIKFKSAGFLSADKKEEIF